MSPEFTVKTQALSCTKQTSAICNNMTRLSLCEGENLTSYAECNWIISLETLTAEANHVYTIDPGIADLFVKSSGQLLS